MVGGVITETSIYVQVFVSFAVRIAKRKASQRCGYVVCVREKPKRQEQCLCVQPQSMCFCDVKA